MYLSWRGMIMTGSAKVCRRALAHICTLAYRRLAYETPGKSAYIACSGCLFPMSAQTRTSHSVCVRHVFSSWRADPRRRCGVAPPHVARRTRDGTPQERRWSGHEDRGGAERLFPLHHVLDLQLITFHVSRRQRGLQPAGESWAVF
jgi:hypothetical protein